MLREFVNGGILFPRATYAAGIHESDPIVIGSQVVPFSVNFNVADDIIAHFDVEIAGEWYEDWFLQVIQVADCPVSLQVHYIVNRFKVRIELAFDAEVVCEVVTKRTA